MDQEREATARTPDSREKTINSTQKDSTRSTQQDLDRIRNTENKMWEAKDSVEIKINLRNSNRQDSFYSSKSYVKVILLKEKHKNSMNSETKLLWQKAQNDGKNDCLSKKSHKQIK